MHLKPRERTLDATSVDDNDNNDDRTDEKRTTTSATPSVRSSQSQTQVADSTESNEQGITYPEGGLRAWLVVLGAFCGTAASIGLYNTSGVFEAYISTQLLPDKSTSSIGWIFGLYAFMTWFLGIQVGPTFDAVGPTMLLVAGSVCTLGGIVALSACTEYYQVILAFSILTGIGTSLLMSPAVASVAHWFNVRRGFASGIAWIGSGVGGVVFSLMLQSLLPQIGWAWSVRAFALVLAVLCAMATLLCRSRIPPRKGETSTWRDALPTTKVFRDGTGAFAVTTAGCVFTDLAYFIPMTYIPSYYIARQHLSTGATLTSDAAFAYQLLAIANGSSCIGRALAGSVADQLGRYNTMVMSLFLCAVSVLCLWLPDILIADIPNTGLLISFVILFGCVSGSNVSLLPVCVGQLCEVQEFGRYYATSLTLVSVGVLISIPVAGALIESVDATGKGKFWAAAVFTGLCYVIATGCFLWVRVRVKGWGWRTKW